MEFACMLTGFGLLVLGSVFLLARLFRGTPEATVRAQLGELLGVDHEGYGASPGAYDGAEIYLQMSIDPTIHASVELFAPIATAWSMRSDVSNARQFRHRYRIQSKGRSPSIDLQTHLMALSGRTGTVVVDADGLHVHLKQPGVYWSKRRFSRLLTNMAQAVQALHRDRLPIDAQVRDPEAHPAFRAERVTAWAARDPEAAAATAAELLPGTDEPMEVRVALALAARDPEHMLPLLAEAQLHQAQLTDLATATGPTHPAEVVAALSARPVPWAWALAAHVVPNSPEGRDALLGLMDHSATDADTAVGVARRLRDLPGSPEGLGAVRSLFAQPDARVATVAARALAVHGDIDDVADLKARGRGAGMTAPLGEACEVAVRQIQARAGGARGGVSLASSDGGALSMVEPPPRQTTDGVPES